MNQQCISIRAKDNPGERCPCKALTGTIWCGRHDKQKKQVRFEPEAETEVPTLVPLPLSLLRETADATATVTAVADATTFVDATAVAVATTFVVAAKRIQQCWRQWLARRCGPLLWFRHESNNPYDFFSTEPVADIPIADFVSFVEEKDGKGYAMDVKSLNTLLDHAKTNGEIPKNPYNRAPLPAHLMRRLLHHSIQSWDCLEGVTPEQTLTLAVTDTYRAIEDLGYYTDPTWYLELNQVALQRYYVELADIWFHRANLNAADRRRIIPTATPRIPFRVPIVGICDVPYDDLREQVLDTCKTLVTAAAARADRQLGAMYVLGALTLVSRSARTAFPWLHEMFAPGVTAFVSPNTIRVSHNAVLSY